MEGGGAIGGTEGGEVAKPRAYGLPLAGVVAGIWGKKHLGKGVSERREEEKERVDVGNPSVIQPQWISSALTRKSVKNK